LGEGKKSECAGGQARGGRGLGSFNTIDGIAIVIVIVLLVLLVRERW
jgi:hypothetical protein